MKITKKILREMILQELPVTASPKDSYNKRMVQYNNGGIEMSTQTVWNAIDGLENSIRKSPNCDPDLLKKILERIQAKISFLQSTASKILKGKVEKF